MAGRLRKRICFYNVVETKNEYNETEENLIYAFSSRAEPVQSEVSRNISSDGDDFSKTYQFRLHYKRSIKSGMVIKVDNEEYEITNVENIRGLNQEIIIDAVNYIQD
uniref:phage head completion protein n=1 Tax=Ningiella ruwaisensis TaxID=2364274 RepID=UPI00109F064A|nr:head-tail adaptor protein [Ningiella ruwaisensis]